MINERIKQLRIQRGLTQAELASTLGIGKTTLAAYEQGKNQPNIETLIKLSNCFNVSTDYLIGHSNVKNIKYENASKLLGLSEKSINNLTLCLQNHYDINAFIENTIFLEFMEAYTQYILFLDIPDDELQELKDLSWGYDSFDINDPFDKLQLDILEKFQNMPMADTFKIYLINTFNKLIDALKAPTD